MKRHQFNLFCYLSLYIFFSICIPNLALCLSITISIISISSLYLYPFLCMSVSISISISIFSLSLSLSLSLFLLVILFLYLYLYIKLEVDFDLVNLKIYNEFCDNSRCRNLTLAHRARATCHPLDQHSANTWVKGRSMEILSATSSRGF